MASPRRPLAAQVASASAAVMKPSSVAARRYDSSALSGHLKGRRFLAPFDQQAGPAFVGQFGLVVSHHKGDFAQGVLAPNERGAQQLGRVSVAIDGSRLARAFFREERNLFARQRARATGKGLGFLEPERGNQFGFDGLAAGVRKAVDEFLGRLARLARDLLAINELKQGAIFDAAAAEFHGAAFDLVGLEEPGRNIAHANGRADGLGMYHAARDGGAFVQPAKQGRVER